ncbi:MAG: Gfo/Idh/MocA family oxidoreductase [Candidatus Pristimantibacillus lignocellulolyticus]|uniref:Gfo/Idh/MocA family oxidoreductase n=1 Tax=Candidatus Pristimantibacillus lignocellulolyticus TaxID=2994561 RepID=A0A9J6ZK97_9BACL|nr:MAG: Gfo/Idh/MocA family oxidoreductase [Candidatus Pristimantibacillus lignocellulolyticus]
MKALVIGYGSIGQRHARLLEEMGIDVSVVSRRNFNSPNFYNNLEYAFLENEYDYIVISNETVFHAESLRELVSNQYEGHILIEKPLFMNLEQINFNHSKTFVAYNLRFHPLIQSLRTYLNNEEVISVNAYVGQYLPSWRPNADYTKSYSASKARGGGVLRDLSHELDYLMDLFGEWHSLVAVINKISDLEIESEDYVQISYSTNLNTRVTVELNYLDRITQRYVIVQTNSKTLKIDFVNNIINCNGELEQLVPIDRDYTYKKQHEAVLNGSTLCCSFAQGVSVVKMIEAAEKSSLLKEWVYNG